MKVKFEWWDTATTMKEPLDGRAVNIDRVPNVGENVTLPHLKSCTVMSVTTKIQWCAFIEGYDAEYLVTLKA